LDHLIHERKSANAGTHKPGTVENGIFSAWIGTPLSSLQQEIQT
jgi:hypothetical protein